MEDYQVKLDNISRKVGILVTRYNELKQEQSVVEEKNKQLERQNKELKEQLQNMKESNSSLVNDLKVAKVSKAIVPQNDEERTELKRKINEFIKEIDRCVAMLND
jgi:F0F1-type ATP synthase membrane subunit b/b'